MNFFAQFLQQPPVPDKDHNNNESVLQDQFTVTKGKTLKGFNDDVSEIQLGSEIINDDSINEIKNQHKLLSGHNQSDNRKPKRYTDKHMSDFHNDPFIGNHSGLDQYNHKKEPKNSKLSIESKISFQPRPTAQFGGTLKREQSLGVSQSGPLNSSIKSTKRKKLTHQLIVNLAELKKLKSQLTQMVSQQTLKYKRHLETIKMNIEIEMRKKLSTYMSLVEMRSSSKKSIAQKGDEETLKIKLRQAEKLIQQYKARINELAEQNQVLQQKQFDLEQKIVGVDLQVGLKFQQKRKQLQKKIFQQLTKNLQSNKPLPPIQPQTKLFPTDLTNKQNTQLVQNLVKQNQFLQNKIKSYQKILLQSDQIRKMKQSLEQRQLLLGKKQYDLQIKKSQIQDQIKHSQKKSVNFGLAQENLSKQINQLKSSLKVKQEELRTWEQELKRKALQINEENSKKLKNSSQTFQQPTSQSYNITFQKPVEQKLNYRSPSDEQFSRKIQSLNFEKVSKKQVQLSKPSDSSTLKNDNIDDHKMKTESETQKFMNKNDNLREKSNKITYDPKQHEGYERYDMQEKQKVINLNLDRYTNIDEQRGNSPNHLSIYDHRLSKKSEFDNVSRESSLSKNKMHSFKLSQHTEGKKVSAQFYQPTTKNTFKYEPHFIQKPTSTPSSKHIPASRLIQNYKSLSPHNRDQLSSMYRGSQQNMRDRYLHPNDKSTFSRSSKDNSVVVYNSGKGVRSSCQGYDMNKSKPKFEIGKLNDLGNKIESLKNQLKNQIDTIY